MRANSLASKTDDIFQQSTDHQSSVQVCLRLQLDIRCGSPESTPNPKENEASL